MKILFFGDMHFDLQNIERTVNAAHHVTRIIKRENPELVINLGDLVVSRGSIHPHVSWQLRRVVQEQAAGRQYVILKGNHDDTYHSERRDTLWGIFGGMEDNTAVGMPNVMLVSEPRLLEWGGVALPLIPTPNKHTLAAWRENNPEADPDPSGMLSAVIAGLIAQVESGQKIVACCHGTIDGSEVSNERVMPAGTEYSLPRHAFRGADLVMCGHIHKPQAWPPGPQHPAGYYVGSIAALTWGEKHRPRVLVLDTESMDVMSYDLPCQQMIQRDVDLTGMEDPLGSLGKVVVESAEKDARLRLVVRGPDATLSIITHEWEKQWLVALGLADITIVKEPTDQALVRLDLDRRWTVEDAFASWLQYRDVPEAEQQQLLELAREVEQSVRDDHLDAKYDFQPVRLELFNWCQYQHLVLDIGQLKGLVNVMGSNRAGKSNLARAIIFALFRKQLAGRTTAALIKRGEQSGRVMLDFMSNGVLYRSIREIRLGGRGAARVDSTLMVHGDSGWQPASEGSAGETQKAIDRLVGPWELFSWTNWAGQNEVGRLRHLTAAELKEVLLAILQRNWEARIEYAKGSLRKLEVKQATAQSRAEQAKEIGEKHTLARAAELDARKNLEAAERELRLIPEPDQAPLLAARERHAALKAEISTVQNGVDLPSAKRDLNHVTTRLEAVQMRLNSLGHAVDVAELRGEQKELETQLGVQKAKAAEAEREFGAARQKRLSEIGDLRERLATLRNGWDKSQKDLWSAESEASTMSKRLGDAQGQAALIDTVPCGGYRWVPVGNPTDVDGVNMDECKFLKQAAASREIISRLEAELVEARRALDDVKQQEAAAKALHEEAAVALTAAEEEWESTSQQFRENEAAIGVVIESINKKLASINAGIAMEQSRSLLHEEAESLGHTLKGLRRRVAESEAILAELADRQAEEKALSVKIEDLEASFAKARSDRAAGERDVGSCREILAKATGSLGSIVEQLEALSGAHDEIRDILNKTILWRKYQEAMHRDGLPYTMLERYALPQLAAAMNKYLAQTEIRIMVSSERTLQTGDQRNEIVMTFTDPCGTFDVSSASGYQESVIGLAFLAANGDLTVAATGSQLSWFAVDEGLGTMDMDNLDKVKHTLKEIAKTRKSFWIISHVGGIDEAADHVIRVQHDVDGSIIEVV